MKLGRVLLALLLLPSLAWAQSTLVYQSGNMQAQHDLAKLKRNGQIEDAGGLLGDVNGRGVNPFAVQDNLAQGVCANSAVTSGQYSSVCLGHDGSGNGLITLDSFGGMANKGFNFRINGSVYPVPGPGNGNVSGPSPSTDNTLALFNGSGGTLLKNGGNFIDLLQTVLPAANTGWGTPGGIISVAGANGFVGVAVNNLNPSTTAFPTGTTGYGIVYPGAAGNAAFGLYGEVDLADHGSAQNEIDCMNYKGVPDTSLPPNQAIGTSTNTCIGLQVGAGGQYNSSIGLHVGGATGGVYVPSGTGSPTAGPQRFNTGIYVGTLNGLGNGNPVQYGAYFDADSGGPSTTIVAQNWGTGINLQLGTLSAMVAANAVISVLDHLGASHFSVRQDGDIYSTGKLFFSQASAPAASLCGTSPAVNANSTDQAGIVTAGTGTVTSCVITFTGAFTHIPACTVTGEAGTPLMSISSKSISAITIAGASSFGGLNFDYHCID